MKIAIYPGSFDPLTNGHLDIIKRALNLCDLLYVVVSINPDKSYIFSNEERVNLVKIATSNLPNVKVIFNAGLTVDIAKTLNANFIIKGIRNEKDLENELVQYEYNNKINPKIETIYLFARNSNINVSSSNIKKLIKEGFDVSNYLPLSIKDEVIKIIKERLK